MNLILERGREKGNERRREGGRKRVRERWWEGGRKGVREREREREGEREGEREEERDHEREGGREGGRKREREGGRNREREEEREREREGSTVHTVYCCCLLLHVVTELRECWRNTLQLFHTIHSSLMEVSTQRYPVENKCSVQSLKWYQMNWW